ncbi:MAG: TIGR02996 domain-containing protein, partial [Kofleriaceae bacterium]
MLIVLATHPELLGPRRLVYPSGEITISAGEGDDVVLAAAPRGHRICRVFMDDREPIVSELSATVPVHAYGRRIGAPTRVGEPSIVRIRAFTFRFRNGATGDTVGAHAPYVAAHATERGLLDELAGGDAASPTVYADWLEERGDPLRAEWLRVQDELHAMTPGEPDHIGHTARLAALATQTEVGWRVRVARSAIERCASAFAFRCPKEWSQLAPTGRD